MSRNLVKLFSTFSKTKCMNFVKFSNNVPVRLRTISLQNVFTNQKPASIQIRPIHVTSSNQALPPIIVLLLRPVTKITAVLFGRYIRKWWAKLTPEQKEAVWKKIRSRQSHIAMAGTALAGFAFLYYLEHIQEDPLTKRKKFIIFNDEQMKVVAEMEFENQVNQFKSYIVPINHPIYKRVGRVANRLLVSNLDIPQIKKKNWGITVVDRPEITNAFVLPEGKIFVFSGMLNICTNDDQLAIVLSHEISHAICSHIAESMSRVIFLDMILLLPSVLFWSVFSDAWALFSEWLTNALSKLLFHLPFSRKIEQEADVVGLKLAAKACYDVREAPVFWAKMKLVNESPIPVEWLSTHPSHERRQFELRELVPIALKVREANNCPLLGPLSRTSVFYGYSQ